MTVVTLPELVAALDFIPKRYQAVRVFADDVAEVIAWRDSGVPPSGWRRIGDEYWRKLEQPAARFVATVDGRAYDIHLFDYSGVVCVSEAKDPSAPVARERPDIRVAQSTPSVATAVKGDAWVRGRVLGLLVGSVIGDKTGSPNGGAPPRHVFPLSFDASTRRWISYSEGLVPWMKQALLASEAR